MIVQSNFLEVFQVKNAGLGDEKCSKKQQIVLVD